MASAWQRKARAVLKAIRVAAAVSADARMVWAHVFETLLDGGMLPSQPELAVDLGMSEASLRRAVAELKSLRLMTVERNGSAPARYQVHEEGLMRVLRGELSAAFVRSFPAQDERTNGVETVPGPLNVSGQTTGSLRNRSITPPTPPADEMSGQTTLEFERRLNRMLGSLRKARVTVNEYVRPEVEAYCRDESLSEEMFEEACRTAGRAGTRGWRFVVVVLDGMLAEEAGAPGIVELDEVRRRRQGVM